MITVLALQGSPDWLAARAQHLTASEAPAMMGASKYSTRTALLRQKATGITPEVDSNTQRLFDRGHAAEAAARQIVEAIIGESLYPVTGSLEVDGLPLLASFDGLTAMDDIVWESKLWNATLADAVRAGQLEPHYYWQLEQQLLVSGAERVYFTTSDGTPENTVGMWYVSDSLRRAQLIAGWAQFSIDLEAYVHTEQTVAPVAAPIEALPALAVTVSGSISLTHNLERFGQRLCAFVQDINAKPETDQDFADLDAAVKVLKEAEAALDSAEKNALAQTTTIADMCSLVEMYRKVARDNRLMFEKIVKAEKENRRFSILDAASVAIAVHLHKLNERIGGTWMPVNLFPASRFSDAIKGLKSLDSMRDKVAGALANAKIEANEIADRIELNYKSLFVSGTDHNCMHLFPDFNTQCLKTTEDFAAQLAQRIQQEENRKEAYRVTAEAKTAAAVAAAVEAERMAEAKRVAEQAAQVQWAKADAGVGVVDTARAQPDTASSPPLQQSDMGQSLNGLAGKSVRAVDHLADAGKEIDAAMIDGYISLQGSSFTEKHAIRKHLEAFMAYRAKMLAAQDMEAAA